MTTSEPNQAAKEVLSYFIRNPQAADNLEGVTRWRLLSELVSRKVDETRLAIGWLVQRQFLIETSLPGAEAIFSLNAEKRAEAEKLLARLADQQSPGNEKCH